MRSLTPLWVAPRSGQDWRDDEILKINEFFISTIDSHSWEKRLHAVREKFENGRRDLNLGKHDAVLFENSDLIAWYIFQANAYAAQRECWYEPEAYRIVPVFTRLGQILHQLKNVSGVMDRVLELMTGGKSCPDDGLYELLVAGAYQTRLWSSVDFVTARPGIAKTQDILVTNGRRRWAVECKRVNKSAYELAERQRVDVLTGEVHSLCRNRGRSIVLEVSFNVEVDSLADNYLLERLERYIANPTRSRWVDVQGRGQIREIHWNLARSVLKHDDVFYGSSRMVELLAGYYNASIDHSVAADWDPASANPLYATAIRQASLVSWRSDSVDAKMRKARHFHGIVTKANKQLPLDCPGVVHIGCEARNGNSEDAFRHIRNVVKLKEFDSEKSRLRWVYANYFVPEHTTDPNESCAITETTAAYKIGRHGTNQPLPKHFLFDSESVPFR
ncbi:MAG: hypothetical protein ACOH2S_23740 [Janthinobacterium svalbardensis]|uniref:hypothetical protein n=1 Tax=Janthinobacterium svalbardensis TaxID=368607 RepID=UPI00142E548A|nr:hypothetical protein [Janthinobacterium svalbardensis]